jgi:hypothetical protein
MKIKKVVDRDSLTPEELEALDFGEKTEEDFIKELEEKEKSILEEAQKNKELAENYRIRAEKAERERKTEDNAPKNELSNSDLIALIKADISEEDIDDVKDYAHLKKISIKDAINSSVIKSLLTERKEERATAEATAVGNKRAGTKPASGEELLSKAERGEVPSSQDEIERLVDARFQGKLNK